MSSSAASVASITKPEKQHHRSARPRKKLSATVPQIGRKRSSSASQAIDKPVSTGCVYEEMSTSPAVDESNALLEPVALQSASGLKTLTMAKTRYIWLMPFGYF